MGLKLFIKWNCMAGTLTIILTKMLSAIKLKYEIIYYISDQRELKMLVNDFFRVGRYRYISEKSELSML